MSESITIADIYKLFEQTNAALEKSREEFNRSIAESRAEADRRAAEADRRAAEADRRAAEADRRAAEADHRLAEADHRLAEADRYAEREKAERDRSMAELKKTVERTSKAVDSLTTRWGRFVEELVRPAVVRMFRDRHILITHTMERVRSPLGFEFPMEIDILGVNGDSLVAVECKSRLSKDDVDEMCDHLRRFKAAFSEYRNHNVYGAVAGIEIDQGIDLYAYRKGLFVVRTNGDAVEIANDEKFQPVAWG
jgi:hypothetical protein